MVLHGLILFYNSNPDGFSEGWPLDSGRCCFR
jgi:hypothetical protein